MNFAVAVKAVIVRDGKVLLIKRRSDDVHTPGVWEIPGGRLDEGEDPFAGLQREAQEEVGLSITVQQPLRVHHFTREDGQRITMIVFLCTAASEDVELSEEHTAYEWLPFGQALERIVDVFREDLRRAEKFQKHF